jgi:sec-independent protein translocase protein TatA
VIDGLLAPTHLLVLLVVAVLVFGPKRLPEMGRALGGGMRSFKDEVSGDAKETDEPRSPSAPKQR